MKLHTRFTINKTTYEKGEEIPWYKIYPFFLFHILGFGFTSFLLAYSDKPADIIILFAFGAFTVSIYVVFYIALFGVDEVRWMFINALLSVLGIYTELGWILSHFGKNIRSYPWQVHVIPFLYVVIYTFLLRHLILDLFGVGDDDEKKKRVENGYIVGSIFLSVVAYFLGR